MQALDKIAFSSNWITIVFMLLLVGIFLLKGMQSIKLKEYFFAFFNKGFIISEIEERTSFFNRFSITLFIFSVVNFALLGFLISNYFVKEPTLEITFFIKILLFSACYFILKWTLEYLLVVLFSIKNEIILFLTAKKIYTFTLVLWLFPTLILFYYSKLNKKILLLIIAFLLIMKLLLLIINNKKLILNKLFYFILYFCAFEIAPLFILFKLIF